MQSRESKQRSWLKMIMEKGKRNCNHTYLLQIYAIGFDSDDLTQNQKNITYGVIAWTVVAEDSRFTVQARRRTSLQKVRIFASLKWINIVLGFNNHRSSWIHILPDSCIFLLHRWLELFWSHDANVYNTVISRSDIRFNLESKSFWQLKIN